MTATSLREKKKARTRDALAKEAYKLFRTKGFESTTTDEIARAADVSPRTFFRYFPTKESVAFPRVEERLDAFRALLAEKSPDESGVEVIGRAFLRLAGTFSAQSEEALAQFEIIETSPSLLAQERMIDLRWEAAIADALLDQDMPSEPPIPAALRARVLAGAVMGLARSILREWYLSRCELDLVALGEAALGVLSALDKNPPHLRDTSP